MRWLSDLSGATQVHQGRPGEHRSDRLERRHVQVRPVHQHDQRHLHPDTDQGYGSAPWNAERGGRHRLHGRWGNLYVPGVHDIIRYPVMGTRTIRRGPRPRSPCGCLIYDSTVSNYGIVAINFGLTCRRWPTPFRCSSTHRASGRSSDLTWRLTTATAISAATPTMFTARDPTSLAAATTLHSTTPATPTSLTTLHHLRPPSPGACSRSRPCPDGQAMF